MMRLTGKEYKKLVQALMSAFPTEMALTKMVRYQLGENIKIVIGSNNLEDIVFKLVQKFEAENRISDLIRSARKENPYNQALRNLDHITEF